MRYILDEVEMSEATRNKALAEQGHQNMVAMMEDLSRGSHRVLCTVQVDERGNKCVSRANCLCDDCVLAGTVPLDARGANPGVGYSGSDQCLLGGYKEFSK
jgi:hypothetical protein